MVPELVPAAAGTALLGLGTISSLAAERRPLLRPVLGRAGALLLLLAGGTFAVLLARRWAEVGPLPLRSRYEASLQALVGLVIGAALLGRAGPVARRASVGACLVGVGLGLLALGGDPGPLYDAAPAEGVLPALVNYTLQWLSFGILLAAAGAACARLFDRRPGEGVPEAWDGALHRVVAVGLPCLLVSLLVGAFWHEQLGWRLEYSWEFGESWTLAILIACLGWLHLRQVVAPSSRVPAIALLAIGLLMAGWWNYTAWAPGHS